MRTFQRLLSNERGAVAVEFLVGFMPLATAFLCFTQASQLYTAHLVFKHAALAAGRAAITTIGPCMPKSSKHPVYPDDVRKAARAAFGKKAWETAFDLVTVTPVYEKTNDAYGDVKTTMKARYKCGVPMGKLIVCKSGFVKMEQEVILPHQGARYNRAQCADE